MENKTLIMISGGFDMLHSGHIELIQKASKFGEVHAILNSDDWLTRKKGKPFMCYRERCIILEAIKYVKKVWPADDEDDTVSATIDRIYHTSWTKGYSAYLFGNGGDRVTLNTPEVDTCVKLGIGLVWGLGDKIQSSSDLIKNITA